MAEEKRNQVFFAFMIITCFVWRCGSQQDNGWQYDSQGDSIVEEGDIQPDPQPDIPEDRPAEEIFMEVIDYVPFDDICGEEDLPLEYDVSSDVLVVLDRSGSMMLTLNHVKNAVNTVAAASDETIWFGLMPFPNSVPPNACRMINPMTECAAPVTPHVTLGPGRAPDIAAALSGLGICGSTPTSETLRNAHAYLGSAGTGHEQYILLATDGVPNCNSSLDPATCTCLDTDTGCEGRPEACLDDEACYDALDDLLGDGVKTYVLGMGSWSGADGDIMNAMAEHGGTVEFYPAENPDEILAAFEEIMGTIVVSCRFDIHPTDEVDADKVNFYIGGEIVPQDPSHTSGWDYVDENTIEFYGEWCDRIMSGDVSEVSATFGCPTYVI